MCGSCKDALPTSMVGKSVSVNTDDYYTDLQLRNIELCSACNGSGGTCVHGADLKTDHCLHGFSTQH